MNMWFALYRKELKAQKNLILFMLLGVVGLDLYALFGVSKGFGLFLTSMPVWVTVLLPPFMLAHSFSAEWQAQTHYQLLALPVRKSITVLCKYLSVMSVGILMAVIAIGGLYLAFSGWVGSEDSSSNLTVSIMGGTPELAELMKGGIVQYGAVALLSGLFLLLGIVSAVEGAKFAVSKWRGLVTIGGFFVCLFLYARFLTLVVNSLREFVDLGIALSLYSVLAGAIFLLIGLFLFEEYVEV